VPDSSQHRTGRRPQISRKRRQRRALILLASTLVVILGSAGIVGALIYNDVANGIHRSDIELPTGGSTQSVPQNSGESNILIMGLDSRLDQNGSALPDDIYNAIRAGDGSDGGYNTNVLMLIHIPAGGGRAVGISIPRDDYVDLPGSPDGVGSAKIKEAYGLALDEKQRELANAGTLDSDSIYQQARAAGRQAEIDTVSQFLGGVAIDHFVEVTMAAFYEVALAVQPVTVCLNYATQDSYSGADFAAGEQQISAQDAMSFVRQRRDTGPSDLELTDFDRTRRQQAFIVSLAYKLKQANTFTNFGTLQSLIDTAKQYIAVDQNLDLLSFAQQASQLAGGNISFVTLPIVRFDTIDGKDVNIVDVDQIQATVKELLAAPTSGSSSSPTPPGQVDPGSNGTVTDSTASDGSTQQSGEPSEPPASTVYSTWDEPLQAGAIPCVN
jgi:LCP family protein required for cell wall assembly